VAQGRLPNRDRDGRARVLDLRTPHEPVDGLEADRLHRRVTDVLRDLGRDDVGLALERALNLEREADLGESVRRELDLDHGARDSDDPALGRRPLTGCHPLFGDCH
jgi:hypothetical protein